MGSPISGITEVSYEGTIIQSATLRREDLNGGSEVIFLTREALLKAVREQGPLVTLHHRASGDWEMMDKIALIRVDGRDYLKCISDGYPCDDLGDVPQAHPNGRASTGS